MQTRNVPQEDVDRAKKDFSSQYYVPPTHSYNYSPGGK